MLVLSRKQGESIEIQIAGETVEFTVLSIRDDQIRLGFEAPRSVIIHRSEVAEEIRRTRSVEITNRPLELTA